MKIYGLIGKNIDYSFSRSYFKKKFEVEGIAAEYRNFDLDNIEEFKNVLRTNPVPSGLNVTIPYKQEIMRFLDQMDPVAAEIGAVNTIKFEKDGSLTGYNTDHYGFTESLRPNLKPPHTAALILGTGGASKAVAFSLAQLKIPYSFVSRNAGANSYSYQDLTEELITSHPIIINCTPLGTYPAIEKAPKIPFDGITPAHLIFDLIYNPAVTRFMELAAANGAVTLNGYRMLELQAENAWKIWNTL
ncbi:shikimate dehydrogenase [Antarcticibacterium flavum]|uniref:Shikimate dehydrogenase n=1 Tax=Antarcticibacterium flavum TaxID=2058175 RepID=A0A5B7X785_9FLAO|nr:MULTISPECIES: shikimate dehydrogenase [Antarcticibacterium]MCM4159346.1 shikimate dehydrogenase [Antarcticibacterium sp. W02-3]QCY70950.1 shikimate dehydrogenase [Antarcticibacterium flavum]